MNTIKKIFKAVSTGAEFQLLLVQSAVFTHQVAGINTFQ